VGDKLSRPGDPWEQADPAGEKSSACHTRLVPDVMRWHAEEELLLGQRACALGNRTDYWGNSITE